MEEFAQKWFLLYYLTLGIFLVTGGIFVYLRKETVYRFIIESVADPQPPTFWIGGLRYFILFTIPCFILSFFPFSIIELLFSVWSFVLAITIGLMLVNWKQSAAMILNGKDMLPARIRFVAANMVSLGIVMFLLSYRMAG
jgi:hypothetical protein